MEEESGVRFCGRRAWDNLIAELVEREKPDFIGICILFQRCAFRCCCCCFSSRIDGRKFRLLLLLEFIVFSELRQMERGLERRSLLLSLSLFEWTVIFDRDRRKRRSERGMVIVRRDWFNERVIEFLTLNAVTAPVSTRYILSSERNFMSVYVYYSTLMRRVF